MPWLDGANPTSVWTLAGAAEELQVVARHHPALRVADEIDLGGAGGGPSTRSTKADSCRAEASDFANAIDAEQATAARTSHS